MLTLSGVDYERIVMPTKKSIWECSDGTKFSTREEAVKHEKNDAFKGVSNVWYDGCIECPNDLIEWIQEHERLVYAILDAASRH
jgi:hypothetical protein